MATTFMNLTLPTVSVTIGPQWATEVNAALTSVDSHDHSSGKGTKITPAGINVNATFNFNEKAITDLNSITYQNLSTLLTGVNTMYVKDGDLFYNDSSANQIRITAGGTIDVGSVGGIGGDYGTTPATVFYTSGGGATKTYFFQDETAAPGAIDVGKTNITGNLTVSGLATFNGSLGGALEGGSYSPTSYVTSNISGISVRKAYYQKVGSVVSVKIYVSITPTSSGAIQWRFSVPVSSTSVDNDNAFGILAPHFRSLENISNWYTDNADTNAEWKNLLQDTFFRWSTSDSGSVSVNSFASSNVPFSVVLDFTYEVL